MPNYPAECRPYRGGYARVEHLPDCRPLRHTGTKSVHPGVPAGWEPTPPGATTPVITAFAWTPEELGFSSAPSSAA